MYYRYPKEFIGYDEALEMQKLGFYEECMCSVRNELIEVDMPTFQQAFRWFRRRFKLDAYIYRTNSSTENNVYWGYMIQYGYRENEQRHECKSFAAYERAELACLKSLIILAKSLEEEDQDESQKSLVVLPKK
jgi:hypothetical protein